MDDLEQVEQQVVPAPVAQVERDLEALIPSFLANRQAEVEQFRALTEQGDMVEVRGLAHGLKGTGGAYGFDELSVIGGHIERAALADDTAGINAQLDRYQHYLDTVQIQYID